LLLSTSLSILFFIDPIHSLFIHHDERRAGKF
jgi:hypothetical protein